MVAFPDPPKKESRRLRRARRILEKELGYPFAGVPKEVLKKDIMRWLDELGAKLDAIKVP